MTDVGPDASRLTAFVRDLGGALLAAGESVDETRRRVAAVASAAGRDDVDVVVLPTAIFVQSAPDGSVSVEVSTVWRRSPRLDQVDDLYDLADRAAVGEVTVETGIERLAAIERSRAPHGPVVRTLGLGVLSAGFALLLQPTPIGVLGAAVLGVLVGLALLIRIPEVQALLPVAVSFAVAALVFGVAERFDGENPIRALIPPLVILLPGAAITTGMMELAVGQMVSGASRLVEGLADLGLLAFGIVIAASLVGAPPTRLVDRPVDAMGPWTTVVAVVVIAIGLHLHLCARRSSLPWIVLVLAVALAGQSFGASVFSAELSGFFGALAMTPLVLWAGRRPGAPASMVMFLPGFWLLVPGAVGLIGVAQLVGSGARLGPADFTAMFVTVLSISLGVLLGTAVTRAGDRLRASFDVV